MIYVLILYAWTVSAHAGNGIATAEFANHAACEQAAQAAAHEFDGIYSKLYWVCVPKGGSQ